MDASNPIEPTSTRHDRNVDETLWGSANESAGAAPNTEASLLWSLTFGAILTVLFYAAISLVQETAFGKVFFNPNPAIAWVPPTLVLLAAWAMCILALKRRKYRAQAAAMKLDILPSKPADIEPDAADGFITHIRSLSDRSRESFLLSRVARALAHFKSRQSRSEVGTLLASQADIDLSRVISSYTMVRTLIWAIPILGFIGTVLGIGTAVDGFSGLSDLTQLEASLAVVTSGLAGAFETTLIALVLSMLIMLPTAASQKSEQGLLSQIDEFCNDSLMRRLKEDADAGGVPDWKGVGRVIAREMKGEMSGFGTQVGAEVGEQIAAILRGEMAVTAQKIAELLQPAEKVATEVNHSVANLGGEISSFSAELPAVIEGLADVPRSLRNELEGTVGKFESLAANLESKHQQNMEMAKSVGVSIHSYAGIFEKEAATLNSSLAQVVGEMNSSTSEFATSIQLLREINAKMQRMAAGLEFRGQSDQVRAAMSDLSEAVQRMVTVTDQADTDGKSPDQ